MKPHIYKAAGTMLLAFITTVSFASTQEDWQQFRKTYPYHIQTVAISKPDATGHRTLIISEPPPTISVAQIQALDPMLQNVAVGKHRIGADGWAADVVIDLPPMPDRQLAVLLDTLHEKLFGTTYKAYVIPISGSASNIAKDPMNLHVTFGDLRSWLLGDVPTERAEDWGATIGMMFVIAVLLGITIGAFRRKKVFAVVMFGAATVWMSCCYPWSVLVLVCAVLMLASACTFRSFKRGWAVGCAVLTVAVAVPLYLHWLPTTRPPATTLRPLLGGPPVSCRKILDRKISGVFVSTNPGIVVWAFPRNQVIDNYRLEARQFAVDSDLLLGAIASADHIAIVGRERVTPVSVLPPLRTETLLQLAGAKEDELGQSFERRNPFAGRVDENEHLDWAPIYLSARLIDTEYGSLLNITDQMLKGWSQHGEVRYVNFNYPDPAKFPFPKPLMEHLRVKEVVFNWNTKGAGYVTSVAGYEIFALNRTGALPVDYLADGKPTIRSAEDTAYDYFADLNDPNLVRVVEYAAMYQLFHYFGIHAAVTATPQLNKSPLLGAAKTLMGLVLRLSDQDLAVIAAKENEPGESAELRKVRDILRLIARNDTDAHYTNLVAEALVSREAFNRLIHSQDPMIQDLANLTEMLRHGAPWFLGTHDRASLMNTYMFASQRHNDAWIHTPSIVLSKGTANAVGGHNLYSKVPLFRADEEIQVGKVAVTEEGGVPVVRYNPADGDKIGETVRDVAREERSAEDIRSAVESHLRETDAKPVGMEDGLQFAAVHPEKLRGLQDTHVASAVDRMGWKTTAEEVPEADRKVLSLLSKRSRGILVERRDDRYVLMADAGIPVEAPDLPSALDAFMAEVQNSSEKQVHVQFANFEDRQAEGFMRSLQLKSEDDHTFVASLRERMTPEQMEAISRGDYSFEKARVLDVQATEFEGEMVKEARIELELPDKAGKLEALRVWIHVVFERAVANVQELCMALQSKAEALLKEWKAEQDLNAVAGALAKELKRDARYSGGKVHGRVEVRDLVHVELHSPIRAAEAAGQPT